MSPKPQVEVVCYLCNEAVVLELEPEEVGCILDGDGTFCEACTAA